MKHLQNRPAALAALWDCGASRDEWEIIEEVRRLQCAGEAVYPGLQRAFNEIMLAAAENGKLPAKRRGVKAATNPREVDAAAAYLKARLEGKTAEDATKAAQSAFPRDGRQIARYVKEHKREAERKLAIDEARNSAVQLSAEWRISLLDAVRDIQYGMQPDTAVVPLRALLTDDFAEITQHEQRISRRVGEMRSITQSSRLSSLNGEPVNDYLADLRCAVRSIEINTLEMQMRQILWIRAHGLENAATRANEQRLAELSAAISAAPVPRDD